MKGSVRQYIRRLYGVDARIEINNVTDSVGTTAELIAKQNPNRAALWISNLSANTLYVLPENTVSSSKGLYIAPNGGNIVLQMNDDFSIPCFPFYAVAGGAGSSILVMEVLLN